ncbi:hypothetical protein DERP_000041 [Dermatophagoides pteronyssinus]|uniref:Uncharacterized protein n=1 Tax=Dermatophagoides pteronyssinus TaxID=6956 RepID=A0ABQ8IZE5_DERPT|nr:hypothetical protein DERP_000041 [Dermatophagoides pteronyssinus]
MIGEKLTIGLKMTMMTNPKKKRFVWSTNRILPPLFFLDDRYSTHRNLDYGDAVDDDNDNISTYTIYETQFFLKKRREKR